MLMQLIKNPLRSNQTTNKRTIKKAVSEKNIFILAPPETVWHLLTHPDAIPQWNLEVQEVVVNNWCFDLESKVVGNYRKVFHKDGRETVQVITDWKPNETFGITTTEGMPYSGIKTELHIELYHLQESVDGTEVHLLNYIEFDESRHHAVEIRKLIKQYRQNLIYLKWLAEQTSLYNIAEAS